MYKVLSNWINIIGWEFASLTLACCVRSRYNFLNYIKVWPLCILQDNKDLGLSVHNMNLDDRKPKNKVKYNALKEEDKLKNTPVAQTKHQDNQVSPTKGKTFSGKKTNWNIYIR